MSSILVYALHNEGAFNKNSLGAVSEGARLAGELGGECHAVVVGDKPGLPDELCASLGRFGATRVYRVEGPEGLAQPVVDAMAKIIGENGHGYALFGGGLLGFEIGAGLTARLDAGVCMEVTNVRSEDGKLVSERPILQDSSVSDVHYRSDVGVIIGRLNAFEARESDSGDAAVEDGALRCERQAEYGYDTVLVELPAVISVGDAINEPRYPSLKAIMGAKKKPLDTKGIGDVGIEDGRVGYDNAKAHCADFKAPPAKEPGRIIEDEDTNQTVEQIVAWLDERKLLA